MASKFKEIEQREGQPMPEILTALYQKCGNLDAVAASLGVSQGTISLWLTRCGLELRYVLVPKKGVMPNE